MNVWNENIQATIANRNEKFEGTQLTLSFLPIMNTMKPTTIKSGKSNK
jgi:hypothetical protein